MQDSSIEGVGSTLGKFLEMYSCNLSLSGVMSTMSLDSGLMFGPVWRQIYIEFLEKNTRIIKSLGNFKRQLLLLQLSLKTIKKCP